ncbi:MAG: tetratricopeptide repeat protein [Spirochaeta sp.]|jgi:TolA-binding protein|nr:tetratricopeptide repeat protein [Spirochaeta sp.]
MYRRSIVVALLAVVSLSTAGADDREAFEEAQRRFDSGAYELAIEQFQSVLDDYPGSTFASRAQLRIAQSYFYTGAWDDALEILQRAQVRARGGGTLQQEIRFWIGLTRFQLREYETAKTTFDAYLAGGEAAQEARARLYRGIARRETGDTAGAADDLSDALSDLAGGERGYAVATLLTILAEAGQNDEILRLYDGETADGPVHEQYREQALRIAADAAFDTGRLDRAEELYRELTDFSAASAQWAYQQLYQIADKQGDRERMDSVFRAAEQRLSGEPERLGAFWLALGSEAVRSGRYELGEFYLSRVWRIRDERAIPQNVVLFLARSIDEQGRREEALELLLESLGDERITGEDEAPRYLAATRILLQLERPEEAQELIASYPGYRDTPHTLYAWSMAAYRSGDLPAVIDRLETPEAQAFSRDVPGLTRILARARLEAGNPREAVPLFRTYLSVRPDETDTRVELVRALVSAEQFSAALQEIDRLDIAELNEGQQSEIAYLRGLGLFHRRDYADALEAFTAVGDNAYEPLLSYHVAWSLYRTGEVAEAGRTVAAVRRALPVELYVDGSYLYAWSLYQQGRIDETVEVLLPLLGAGADDRQRVDVRQLLASAYLAQGADDDALAQYREIIAEADRDRRMVHRSRYAGVLASLGRDEAAVNEYDAIASAYPDTESGREALLEAGQILYTREEYAAARDRFRTYRNRFPRSESFDRALYWGGQSSAALGELERALLWWEPLVIEYPRSSYTPRALFRSAGIHAERNRTREALELYDRYVAAYPEASDAAAAERRRQELRLKQSGLTATEAELWTELEPISGQEPEPGSDRWFELVLELGRLAIREQITLSFERNRIIPKLQEASEFSGEQASRAHILLAEYYQRRGETRRAVERYIEAASTDGAPDELRAQSLFRLAEVAAQEGDRETVNDATEQLQRLYPDSIWADQVERFNGGER